MYNIFICYKSKISYKLLIMIQDTVTACARVHALNLKNLSISACDSSDMISSGTK